jgi:hypothetical protein
MNEPDKFTRVAPMAWGAVLVVTIGLFVGTLLIDARRKR